MPKHPDFISRLKHAETHQLPTLLKDSARWRPGRRAVGKTTIDWLETVHDELLMKVVRIRHADGKADTIPWVLLDGAFKVLEGRCEVTSLDDVNEGLPPLRFERAAGHVVEASGHDNVCAVHPLTSEVRLFSVEAAAEITKTAIRDQFRLFRKLYPAVDDTGVS